MEFPRPPTEEREKLEPLACELKQALETCARQWMAKKDGGYAVEARIVR